MDLKESLSFYRKEQGLSQVELAEALDVSRQTISKWETGAALPSAENLLALSRLYGVTVDALPNGVETEAPAEPAPAPRPEPDPSLIPRRKLIARMLAAILLADLVLFFMDISWYATSFRSASALWRANNSMRGTSPSSSTIRRRVSSGFLLCP